MIFLEYVGLRASLSATINGCIPKGCGFFCVCAPQARLQGRVYKLFKPFLQSRERGDLIVVFVIHCPIDCCDNTTKKSLFRARSTSASLGTVIF